MTNMNRRQTFAVAAIAISATSFALRTRVVQAQEGAIQGVVSDIIETAGFRDDNEAYLAYRWGAYTYANLVTYFGPPDGSIRDGSEDRSPYSVLDNLLPSLGIWLSSRADKIAAFSNLGGGVSRRLTEAMNSLYQENESVYNAWLESVGIIPSGRLANKILGGQALATIADLESVDYNVGNFVTSIRESSKKNWWFYPIC